MSNQFKKTSETKSIQFGKFGSVAVEIFEDFGVEVYAKLENSVNGDSGPTFSDDCNLGGGSCTPVTAIE